MPGPAPLARSLRSGIETARRPSVHRQTTPLFPACRQVPAAAWCRSDAPFQV